MGIQDEDVARVRAASDIVAVISQHTQLRKVGQRWSGICPFHNEKSPSFSVNPTEGVYYCFGCRVSGDVITFVREIEHLDFVGAVEWLAAKAGIGLTYTDRDEGQQRRRSRLLQEAMAKAVLWYHDRLLNHRDAGAARRYLRTRGFDRELVEKFQIGWAPDRWDELSKHVRLPADVLTDCGLGFVNRAGKQQDFFRARILFPIYDDQGRPVAFGGRKLPDTDGPKYQNSRENALYKKSSTLYGLNWAKSDIVRSNEVVVCEGYTDVIGFVRAGIPRAVATCGTAMTEDHIKSLKRFTRRIVLAYDGDEAGQRASDRVFEWEARHEVEISVLALDAATDPDELSRTNPAALVEAVEQATPILGFRVSRVLKSANLATPEGRARAASAALAVVAEHPSSLVRDQYVMEIAGFCRVDEQRIREELQRIAAGLEREARSAKHTGNRSGKSEGRDSSRDSNRDSHRDGSAARNHEGRDSDGDPGPWEDGAPPPELDQSESSDSWPGENRGGRGQPTRATTATSRSRPVAQPREGSEMEALRMMLNQQVTGIPDNCAVLFADPRCREGFELLTAHDHVSSALEAASEATHELLARLVVEESGAEPLDVLIRLTSEATRRAMASFELQARKAADPLDYAPVIGWLKLRLDDLRDDEPTMESLDQLLAWLPEHASEFE